MLSIDDLCVNYGPVQALSHVSLEVPRGEVTAVIGANGAGKSTLMRTLAGLVKPASGSASLDGKVLTGHKAEDVVRMGVSLVPEGRSTVPELTVDENLRLGGMWRSRAARTALHAQFYDMFPVLGERRKMRADTLSGGERQQLAIGRALMCAPECLLLDEPSLGLAPLIVTQILEMVKGLATEANIAVLLVEQNAVTALRVAHTAVVLNLGQVVMSGRAADIAAHEELRHAYLGY
ncbi:MAG: ABC transporter ATP-binding protein [Actinobacteria bacterium]|nr:ABC transporter ATP-binding protein [Actinomycetota bacterium]